MEDETTAREDDGTSAPAVAGTVSETDVRAAAITTRETERDRDRVGAENNCTESIWKSPFNIAPAM